MGERCEITYEMCGEARQATWQENDTGPGWSFLVPEGDPVLVLAGGTILKNFVVTFVHGHAPLFGPASTTRKSSEPVNVEFTRADWWDEGLQRVEFAKDPILCPVCGTYAVASADVQCGSCEESNQPEDFTAGWKHAD